VHDLLNPDMLLIGESDERAGDLLESLYREMWQGCASVQRMNWINAETAKIAVNTYVTAKITFANMLSELCEKLPGADVDVVTRAVGADNRIGTSYLRGALGYGGPCFPRDNIAFTQLAGKLGVRADLAKATHELNLHQVARINALVNRLSPADAIVAVLGLSYKPNTPIIEASQGVTLAAELATNGRRVLVYDPLAMDNAMAVLRERAQRADSAAEAVASADVVVVTTNCKEFSTIPASVFQRPHGKPLLIIDCWRVFSPQSMGPWVDLVHLGVGPNGQLPTEMLTGGEQSRVRTAE